MFFDPFFGDPIYLILMVVGMGLVFLPQLWVKNTYNAFSEVPSARGLTGAEVARAMLQEHGIANVTVEAVPGELSDHYDPSHHAVRLSEANYYGRSIAGVAVAAHEVGHAIQHAKGYVPVVIRSSMVPLVNIGSQMGPLLLMISFTLGAMGTIMPSWAYMLAWVGVIMFAMATAFHLVTLPVELDASGRALKALSNSNYLMADEMPGARKVLTAAAFTYVAAALYSLMQLLYYVFRLLNARREE
jgi:Zn-dependent membrane protease YugP